MLNDRNNAGWDLGAMLGVAVVLCTVALSARGYLSILLFLRSRELLTPGEATVPAMFGAIITSQGETLGAWLMVSALLTLALGVWLPAVRTSFIGMLGVVGISHLPLLLWSICATAVGNVLFARLIGEVAVRDYSRSEIEGQVIALSGMLISAKSVAYVAAMVLCIRLLRKAEGVSVAVAAGAIGVACAGTWVLGQVL
jgi:hypothetical protein